MLISLKTTPICRLQFNFLENYTYYVDYMLIFLKTTPICRLHINFLENYTSGHTSSHVQCIYVIQVWNLFTIFFHISQLIL
jgi:hypothetical protein